MLRALTDHHGARLWFPRDKTWVPLKRGRNGHMLLRLFDFENGGLKETSGPKVPRPAERVDLEVFHQLEMPQLEKEALPAFPGSASTTSRSSTRASTVSSETSTSSAGATPATTGTTATAATASPSMAPTARGAVTALSRLAHQTRGPWTAEADYSLAKQVAEAAGQATSGYAFKKVSITTHLTSADV